MRGFIKSNGPSFCFIQAETGQTFYARWSDFAGSVIPRNIRPGMLVEFEPRASTSKEEGERFLRQLKEGYFRDDETVDARGKREVDRTQNRGKSRHPRARNVVVKETTKNDAPVVDCGTFDS
jgi:hypothetical protein